MPAHGQVEDLLMHRTAGVVHLLRVANDAGVDDVAAAIRHEFEDCHAWAVVIEVPEGAAFTPADAPGVVRRLGEAEWKICLDVDDPQDLARLWHVDGHEVRISRP